MSRYCDDYDDADNNSGDLWASNYKRALTSKRGQKMLGETVGGGASGYDWRRECSGESLSGLCGNRAVDHALDFELPQSFNQRN